MQFSFLINCKLTATVGKNSKNVPRDSIAPITTQKNIAVSYRPVSYREKDKMYCLTKASTVQRVLANFVATGGELTSELIWTLDWFVNCN